MSNQEYLNTIDEGFLIPDLDKIISGYTGGICDSKTNSTKTCWTDSAHNNHGCDTYCIQNADVWLFDLLNSVVNAKQEDLVLQPISTVTERKLPEIMLLEQYNRQDSCLVQVSLDHPVVKAFRVQKWLREAFKCRIYFKLERTDSAEYKKTIKILRRSYMQAKPADWYDSESLLETPDGNETYMYELTSTYQFEDYFDLALLPFLKRSGALWCDFQLVITRISDAQVKSMFGELNQFTEFNQQKPQRKRYIGEDDEEQEYISERNSPREQQYGLSDMVTKLNQSHEFTLPYFGIDDATLTIIREDTGNNIYLSSQATFGYGNR